MNDKDRILQRLEMIRQFVQNSESAKTLAVISYKKHQEDLHKAMEELDALQKAKADGKAKNTENVERKLQASRSRAEKYWNQLVRQSEVRKRDKNLFPKMNDAVNGFSIPKAGTSEPNPSVAFPPDASLSSAMTCVSISFKRYCTAFT